MSGKILKGPITIVFKTSNRSNARVKMKTYKKKSIDDILTAKKLVGVPENAIILEMGMGTMFEKQWKQKYKL